MTELLAPGGSCEGLKAAINAGADAVYMGGIRFGARAYAQNPEENDLLFAMDYCHLRERKLYLTVNTLLKEQELERELYDYLLPLYEHGLDAVLVQDLGVFQFIRRNFPELPLHVSTQMTISGVDGVRLLKGMGAQRVVLSRELTLDEIRKIRKEVDIELECFVHGALCYCYSGQCLFSSMIGGRSGNRGRCAQPCRLPYDLYQEGVRLNSPGERYLLNLKDISALALLPDLADIGIASLKIEGRMKRPEYAAGVTRIYRKYIDLYQQHGREQYCVDPEDERILMDLYNRGGFSKGYYYAYNSREMMAMERPNHCGTKAAQVVGVRNGKIRLKALEPLWVGDALEVDPAPGNTGREWIIKEQVARGKEFWAQGNLRLIKNGQVFSRVRSEQLLQDIRENYLNKENQEKIKGKFILKKENSAILRVTWKNVSVTVEGEKAQNAANRPLEEETVRRQLNKTGNTPFLFEKLEIQLEEGLFYPMQGLNELRRIALGRLKNEILFSYKRKASPLSEPEIDPFAPGIENMQMRASVETFEQFYALLEQCAVSGIYMDCCMFMKPYTAERGVLFGQAMQMLHDKGKRGYLALPQIWRERGIRSFGRFFPDSVMDQADGFLLRSVEQLEYMRRFAGKKELIADSSIYTYNKEARAVLRNYGISRDTLPLECNRRELMERGCQGSECIIYGHLPLMVTAQCLAKNTAGCRRTPGVLMLKDRKNMEFPVRNQCSLCTNTIYNSLPLDLISMSREVCELKPASCRLNFTFEDAVGVKEITRAATECFFEGAIIEKAVSVGTRGHFKRGVE